MKLYSRWLNSAGERVRIALNLKGIVYEYVPLTLQPTAEYRRINPQALLPALEVEGAHIPQAAAILEFLEERFPAPPLLPDDPILRAQARGFGAHIAAEMHAIAAPRVRGFLGSDLAVDAAGVDRWVQHWMTEGFAALEATLANRRTDWPFCFGEAPGWADLHLVPQLTIARRLRFDPSPFSRLLAVEARCVVLEPFRRAIPANQPDYPGDRA